MLKIGILAIGEGGSNIGEYAVKRGIQVLVVNGASIDLDKVKSVPQDNRIYLAGFEGAGRNRQIGKNALLSYSEEIFEKSKTKFQDCDLVFVAGATSGGTGSGGLPIGFEILSELKNFVGAITILPDQNESPQAQMNSLECFSELSQYENLNSIFTIDNEVAKNVFKDSDRMKIFENSNKQIIENLVEVASLTNESSFISNFDKNDFLGVINERGCTIISKIVVPIESLKSSEDIVKTIHESWSQSCSFRANDGQIVKAAILGRIPKEFTMMIDTKSIFEAIGKPLDIIEAYYPIIENQNHCIFYTILSGLSFPFSRLSEMEKNMQNIEQDLTTKVEQARKQKFETSNTWSSKFSRQINNQEKRLSLKERLQKFQ